MKKVILEILALLWKVLRVVMWKWLKPLLFKVAGLGVLFVALVVALVVMLGGC